MTVSRKDLKGFDKTAVAVILDAQERGARIKISKRGHAIVYGPNGGTAAVSRHSKGANRSAQNTRADVERLFKKE